MVGSPTTGTGTDRAPAVCSLQDRMSLPLSELQRLNQVVVDLRKEVLALRSEVVHLEGRVIELESQQIVGAARAESEFEVVSLVDSAPLLPVQSVPVAAAAPTSPELPADRVAAAHKIGQFLRRCLSGEPRGSSGRDRIAAPSSVYIICQSYDKQIFNPPKVFFNWSSAKPWVIKNGSPGPSIFVGVPSVSEARIAVEASGCELPETLL